eukprot:947783-Amphidinium_carterae.1
MQIVRDAHFKQALEILRQHAGQLEACSRRRTSLGDFHESREAPKDLRHLEAWALLSTIYGAARLGVGSMCGEALLEVLQVCLKGDQSCAEPLQLSLGRTRRVSALAGRCKKLSALVCRPRCLAFTMLGGGHAAELKAHIC